MINIALKRLCPKCQKVIEVDRKYCEECERAYNEFRKNNNKSYDKKTRNNNQNKQYSSFYRSKEWEIVRSYIISKYKNIDVYEYYKTGKIIKSETVHHIVELRDDFNRRLDTKNLIPISLSNHGKIHLLYKRNKKKYQSLLIDMLSKFEKEFNQVGGL